jgi:hypothetical protein
MSDISGDEPDFDWQWPENRCRHREDREPLQPPQPPKKERPKYHKYHKYSTILMVLYTPLITVPWILTCVMARRPLTKSSFYSRWGLNDRDIATHTRCMNAINVLNSIASVVTIPLLSALVAQAAAVYSQKYKNSEAFHLDHLIALADRGWTNPLTVLKSWKWRQSGSRSIWNFLFLSSIIILLGEFWIVWKPSLIDFRRGNRTAYLSGSSCHRKLSDSYMQRHELYRKISERA